jgi:RNA polymerase sigma factor (sigma-70 family)
LAAVPSIGRASRVEGGGAPEADLTRALYEQYANQIFRYCLHQLGSREEAEDAVQSTFLNAFRGIRRGVVPEIESAWLFKIAHNVCLSRRRSTWRRGRVESPADFDLVEERTAAPARRADELIGLQDVLERMPENQRRAILLREWQGLSYREIAEELELTQAAVETLIFRARRALAQGLEQPREPARKRLARSADLGNILAGIKSALVGGSVAVKVATTVAVVSGGTVVAAAPVQSHHPHRPLPVAPAAKPAPVHHSTSRTTPRTGSKAPGVEAASPAGGLRVAAKRRGPQGLAASTPAHRRTGRTAVLGAAGAGAPAAETPAPPQAPVEPQAPAASAPSPYAPPAAPAQPLVATPPGDKRKDKGKSESKGASEDNGSGDESDHAGSNGADSIRAGASNGEGNRDSNGHAVGKDQAKEAAAAVLTLATAAAAPPSPAPASATSTGPLLKKQESDHHEKHGRSSQGSSGADSSDDEAAATPPAAVTASAPAPTGATVVTPIATTTTATTTAPTPSSPQSTGSTPQAPGGSDKAGKHKGEGGNDNGSTDD